MIAFLRMSGERQTRLRKDRNDENACYASMHVYAFGCEKRSFFDILGKTPRVILELLEQILD